METYKEFGLEKHEWLPINPCDVCALNDGAVVNIGSPFPSGVIQPPQHPNCRCALIPVIPDMSETPNQNGVVDIAPEPARQLFDVEDMKALQQYQMQNPNFAQVVSNEEVYQAVDAYKSNAYGRINEYLRSGQVSPLEQSQTIERIAQIDKAIQAAPGLPEPIVTFRGVKSNDSLDALFGNLRAGDEWIDLGYSSTTMSQEYADLFVEGWQITIQNPAGSKGIMIDGLFEYIDQEFEWLLPRGSKFEVISNDLNAKEIVVRLKQ
jgi:hypothetical protein